jgi:hypothetical protein
MKKAKPAPVASTRRFCAPILTLAFTLLGVACTETKTPTEPPLVAVTPTPAGPAATLSGVVRDQSGAPYPGIVSLQCQTISADALREPVGAYTMLNLKPGTAVLNVFAQGQRTPQTFDLDLRAGDNRFDPRITILHGQPASMSGVVTFPVALTAGAAVVCQTKFAAIAGDGSYTLAGLESGRWDASVIWPDPNYPVLENDFSFTVTLNPGTNVMNVTVR